MTTSKLRSGEIRDLLNEELRAKRLAKLSHAGQTDKQGRDYFEHLHRVALLAADMDDQSVALCRVRAVGYLHDILEDTSMTAEGLLDGTGISAEVVTAVQLLTRQPTESYAAFIERVKTSGNELAFKVKNADLRDNLRPGCPPHLFRRYLLALMQLNDITFAQVMADAEGPHMPSSRPEDYDQLRAYLEQETAADKDSAAQRWFSLHPVEQLAVFGSALSEIRRLRDVVSQPVLRGSADPFMRELVRYRHFLRNALYRQGMVTNPGSTDDEIREKLAELLHVPVHTCRECQ